MGNAQQSVHLAPLNFVSVMIHPFFQLFGMLAVLGADFGDNEMSFVESFGPNTETIRGEEREKKIKFIIIIKIKIK